MYIYIYIYVHAHTHLQASTIVGTTQFETEYLYSENPILYLRCVIQNICEWQTPFSNTVPSFC
jgi:hypothetical protein